MSPEYVGYADAVKLFFSNYVNFKGRSTRSEYWWSQLAVLVIFLALMLLYVFVGPIAYLIVDNYTEEQFEVVEGVFVGVVLLCELAIIIPNLALTFRRLHDVGKSGWWILINGVPIVGVIVFFVTTLLPSDSANKWGEPAKDHRRDDVARPDEISAIGETPLPVQTEF